MKLRCPKSPHHGHFTLKVPVLQVWILNRQHAKVGVRTPYYSDYDAGEKFTYRCLTCGENAIEVNEDDFDVLIEVNRGTAELIQAAPGITVKIVDRDSENAGEPSETVYT